MKENALLVKLVFFKGLYGKYATVNYETKLKYNLYSYLLYNEQFFFSLKYINVRTHCVVKSPTISWCNTACEQMRPPRYPGGISWGLSSLLLWFTYF